MLQKRCISSMSDVVLSMPKRMGQTRRDASTLRRRSGLEFRCSGRVITRICRKGNSVLFPQLATVRNKSFKQPPSQAPRKSTLLATKENLQPASISRMNDLDMAKILAIEISAVRRDVLNFDAAMEQHTFPEMHGYLKLPPCFNEPNSGLEQHLRFTFH